MDARGPEGHGRERHSSPPTPPPARRPAWSRPRSGSAQRRVAHPRRSPICRGRSTSRTAARRRRRTGSTPPASSRSAISTAARCWSSWPRTRSRSPSARRPFFGPPDLSNYTIEADVRSMERRRQMGDVGIVAQRYELVLFGNHQRLELQPWQPETQRTVRVDYKWKPDTWYVMKLEVQTLDGGKVRARGKVWPKGEAGAGGLDDRAHRPDRQPQGQPGHLRRRAELGAAAAGPRSIYDNIKVYQNKQMTSRQTCALAAPSTAVVLRRAASLGTDLTARSTRQRRLADVGRHARPQHGLEHEGAADRPGTSRRRRTSSGSPSSARRPTATRSSPTASCSSAPTTRR